jgi:membrane protease YdiL (CAAX protease family)
MFRGLILTNLAPYGKGMAIVTSALLFGLMHMNPAQFFYTTLMGIILGLIYVKTGSIWVCIAIHFANNAIACLQEVFFGCMEYDAATRASSVLMILVVGFGFLSVLILLIAGRIKCRRAPAEIGSFGRICEPDMSYEERAVSRKGKIPLFFSSTNAVFTIWVFSMMFVMAGATMLAGILYGLLGLFGIY